MKYPLPLALLVAVLFSCGPDAETTEDNAADTAVTSAFAPAKAALDAGGNAATVGGLLMQKFTAVSDAQTNLLDEKASRDFVAIATELADKYPDDTLAALPYYRAAEVVRALNEPKRAAVIYEAIHTKYPTWSKAPEALFMLGFTYDEDLGNLEAAKTTYERFLALYPDNVFAESTPMLLNNLGKSDEEMLRQLEQTAQ